MGNEVERTDDGRFIVVDGRKWRATNPNIPAPLRTELVKALMAARRAVKEAAGDPEATAAARRRVHQAKVALGERGDPWWEPSDEAALTNRVQATIRALVWIRGPESSICPSDIARIVASPDWRGTLDTVRSVGAAMAAVGEIVVTQGGSPVTDASAASGPIRYVIGPDAT